MSGINNVSPRPPVPQHAGRPQGFSPKANQGPQTHANRPGNFAKPDGVNRGDRLQQKLESAGYDQETIDQVKSDIETAIQTIKEQSTESGGIAREDVRAAIQEVFEQHGIDSSALRTGGAEAATVDVVDAVDGLDESA